MFEPLLSADRTAPAGPRLCRQRDTAPVSVTVTALPRRALIKAMMHVSSVLGQSAVGYDEHE